MRKKILIVLLLLVLFIIVFLICNHKKKEYKSLKNIDFGSIINLDKEQLKDDNKNISVLIEEEEIDNLNKDIELNETSNEPVIQNTNIIQKKEHIENNNNKSNDSIKIESNNEKDINISNNNNEVVEQEYKETNIQKNEESTKVDEIKKESSINVEIVKTDANGNSMNKETCYKESVDIQFRKEGISSTGCFSTNTFNNNGEEIYYLDVRYK